MPKPEFLFVPVRGNRTRAPDEIIKLHKTDGSSTECAGYGLT